MRLVSETLLQAILPKHYQGKILYLRVVFSLFVFALVAVPVTMQPLILQRNVVAAVAVADYSGCRAQRVCQ